MTTATATGESDRSWCVSTGRLPPPERVATLARILHKATRTTGVVVAKSLLRKDFRSLRGYGVL